MIKKFFNWLFGTTPNEADFSRLQTALSQELAFPVPAEDWPKRKASFKKAIKKPVAKKSPQVKAKTPVKKVVAKKVVFKTANKSVKAK